MRSHARVSLLALLTGALVALLAPAAAQAAFGVESFFASNCKVNTCKKVAPSEELEKAEKEGFTQAAGHPNYGITDFKINTTGEAPSGVVTHIRTDVAPGVSTNPQATKTKCSMAEFDSTEIAPGFFLAPNCKEETEIGVNEVVVFTGASDMPVNGKVYNLEQPKGLSSDFGVALELPKGFTEFIFKGLTTQLYAHTLIEGNVEWGAQAAGTGKADYHDYFEINVSPALPLISSRLIFNGRAGEGDFLVNPTSCTGTGPQTTTGLTLTPKEGAPVKATYTPPIGTSGCGLAPFAPTFSLKAGTTQQDQPDGLTAELGLPHNPAPEALDSSQLRTAKVILPEGMTLNPSAAHELEACTPAQARIHSATPGVACPPKSNIGEVSLEVPGLPAGSLKGAVYLGGPESGPITAPPYTVYVDAESERYGVSVRVKGTVTPNEATGQLTAEFAENPEQPFTNLKMVFKGGSLAPIANPLTCGTATSNTVLSPFTGTAAKEPLSSFVVDSNNAGGSCASPVPFAPTQGTENQTSTAGAKTNFTFSLERSDGQQYLSKLTTVLPAGLIGLIPTAEQCTEAQANAIACPAGSQIGTVVTSAGSGSTPYQFSGKVYLTASYRGAPYGMEIVVPTAAGPFNLGNAVARATISVDPHTARVIVSSELPTIVYGGIPIRMRKLSVSINRQGFLQNPTNCGVLATESTVTGTLKTSVSLSTPFQVANCSALAFKPSFKASTSGKNSKANGASLETTINQVPGQANIKSVQVTLPKQLPSRLTTLQKACPEATFAANPYSCPVGSLVGSARANTPTLPGKLTGPAYLVSHGGAAFPDLDLVLAANGVRVILVGNTDIKRSITTSTFATPPDVPVSSITVNLPLGPHSALASNGDLCKTTLVMPTTITGQNGVVVKQNTKIAVKECGVRIVGGKVIGSTAYITVRTFAPGRVSGSGGGLATVFRHLGRASNAATLKVPLSRSGRRRGRPFTVRLRVGFVPNNRRTSSSVAFTTVTFR